MKNLLIIFCVFILTVFNNQKLIGQDKVFIPDSNFRVYLNNYYPTFMDISKDSLIIDSAATITGGFYCGGNNIKDLTGIEYFVNIEILGCGGNKLDSLPELSALTLLTEIECGGNFMTRFPDVSNNTALTKIRCSQNRIDSLPDLSTNTQLEYLDCDHNLLTTLPDLSSNSLLSEIHCNYNNIDTLPDLSGNPNLKILECNNNNLTKLPSLAGNPLLTHLYCNNNLLSSLPDLSGNSLLEQLYCNYNDITFLPDLSGNYSLEYLYCGYNLLTSLPDLSSDTSLTRLVCDNNKLIQLPDLSNNINLEDIECTNNLLTSLPDLSHNINLEELYCDSNYLTSLPEIAGDNMKELVCNHNLLTTIPDLSDFDQLFSLECSYNQLTYLPDLSDCNALKAIYCNNNKITTWPNMHPYTHTIRIQNNLLTEIPDLSGYYQFTDINISNNLLTNLPQNGFYTFLHHFICNDNKFDFSDACDLRIIDTLDNFYYLYVPQKPFGNSDSIFLDERDTLILGIASQDSALIYQWFKDTTAIMGETDTILIIKNISLADSGIYTCKSFGSALAMPPMNHGPGITEFVSEPFYVYVNATAHFTGLKTDYCIGDMPDVLFGRPKGGIFSGEGISDSLFIPDSAGVGTHKVYYSYTDLEGGVNYDSQIVSVHAIPLIDFINDTNFCSGEIGLLEASPKGGVFYGLGVFQDSLFNTATMGLGETMIYYSYSDVYNCTGLDSQIVVVNPIPDVIFILAETEFCLGEDSVVLTGSPDGGVFFGTGIYSDSLFLPDSAGTGTHTLFYYYQDEVGCESTDSTSIEVHICSKTASQFNFLASIDVFPNPSMDEFLITIKDLQDEIIEVSVFNITGQQVFFEILNIDQEFYTKQINLKNCTDGTYFIRISNDRKDFLNKTIIKKNPIK
ncbi:MAG: leucine-rich repeat domain-containing protein [Bacteroidales bacterium]|nr:leucine-rich repeat domain-containing protein [Bacteroidales bacterium]